MMINLTSAAGHLLALLWLVVCKKADYNPSLPWLNMALLPSRSISVTSPLNLGCLRDIV